MWARAAFVSVAGICTALVLAGATSATSDRQRARPLPLTPSSLVGSDSFELYCSSCHGADARGRGPVAAALKTPPADLTLIACRNGGVYPAEQVREYIGGERRVTAHGPPDMPVWGATLRGLDASEGRVRIRIDNLTKYIGSLQLTRTPGESCETDDDVSAGEKEECHGYGCS